MLLPRRPLLSAGATGGGNRLGLVGGNTVIVSSWSSPAPSLAPRIPCYNPPCRETLEYEEHLSSWRFRRLLRTVFSVDLVVPKARKELKLLPLNPGTKSEAKTKNRYRTRPLTAQKLAPPA